jgi:hypothetical protein
MKADSNHETATVRTGTAIQARHTGKALQENHYWNGIQEKHG